MSFSSLKENILLIILLMKLSDYYNHTILILDILYSLKYNSALNYIFCQ